MNRPRAPLAQRMARSDRWKERYRNDPEYRLAKLNKDRARRGEPPIPSVDDIPPVGQMRPAWANARVRDDKGRFQ